MYQITFILFVIIPLIWGKDYYEILGIDKSASKDEIQRAFKKLAIIHHPDKNIDDPNAHEKFVRLTTAYDVLKNNDLRKKYDLYGENGLKNFNEKQTHSWNSPHQNRFIYDYDSYIIHLNKKDYYINVLDSDSNWFVNFYSPLCHHCVYLAPTWTKIAKLFYGIMKIAVVNCQNYMQLCYQNGINIYPTLMYFKKNSHHGIHYTGERSQEAIMQFALDKLNIDIPEISASQWELFLRNKIVTQRPTLIFICSDQQNCFTSDERLIIAAKFDEIVDVKVFTCENKCPEEIPFNTHVIYLPTYDVSSWEPVFFNMSDIDTLIEKILEQLPGLQELTDNYFDIIEKTEFNAAWLICFYINNTANLKYLNLQMKKLSISGVNLGKINCLKNEQFCTKLGINRYPIWGIFKPGGAFELNHEKVINDIDLIQFIQISAKATNVRALSAEEVLLILEGDNKNEVWFLDWYSPWCPPCIQFLSELRKASLAFDASIIRFGTIDCVIHTTLCHRYNIKSYPTAILLNGSSRYQFTLPKTAANIIQFINEKRDPSVIELTSKNFYHTLAKKTSKIIWIVDYFVPWCLPCQRLTSEWIVVAKTLDCLSFVNIASVDCEAESSLCSSERIRSYPEIRIYPLGSKGLSSIGFYNGQQDSLSILTWITKFLPKRVHDLTPKDYRIVLDRMNNKYIWIVDFYLPRCWACQKMEPEFAIAAQLLEKVKFGKINCYFYMDECAHINEFPTLILYKPKQKKKKGNDIDIKKITARTAKAIRDEVLKLINFHKIHDEL